MIDVNDPALKKRFRSIAALGRPSSFSSVPIFINCFNRVTVLQRLVKWLLDAGQRQILLLDNGSSWPPLLKYYEELAGDPRVTVVGLARNFGHVALWASDILNRLNWRKDFVYTDPDILPDDTCPGDSIRHFAAILDQQPTMMKVGFGLRIDDIPDCYRFKAEVIAWEKQFWDIPVGSSGYLAPIDTTFALYRGGTFAWTPELIELSKRRAIRTGAPYLARHLDWYMDSDRLTEEQVYYRAHAVPGVTTWSLETLPPKVARDVELARRGARMIPLPPRT